MAKKFYAPNQNHQQWIGTRRTSSWYLYGVDSERAGDSFKVLSKAFNRASWGQLSCPDILTLLPPSREQGMCMPSTPSLRPCTPSPPRASALDTTGKRIPRRNCLCGTFQHPLEARKDLHLAGGVQQVPVISSPLKKIPKEHKSHPSSDSLQSSVYQNKL